MLRWLVAALGATALLLLAAWWAARPAVPDAFYAPPSDRSATPGQLLRHEAFERGVPAGARAWRILYTTTRADGINAVASAIVMVSRQEAPTGARPVIAWTHGTTGVAPGCAPSLLDDPFANVPALQPLLDQGWVYVATDYVGQGTEGPHPYLIGEGQARSALDAVRAARRLEGLRTDPRTVVWGHSQGGHAALWTGIVAPSYAPDVPLAGVAAVAPASDLVPLIDSVQHPPVGRIMSSFVLQAYDAAYDDVRKDDYVSRWKQALVQDMAGRCLAGRQALLSVLQALLLRASVFASPPGSGALGTRLAQNTPERPISAPLLIAQGQADDLVLPAVQARYIARRCAAGQVIQAWRYPGRDHLSVVGPDSPLAAHLIAWTQDRLGGKAAPAQCLDESR